MLYYAALFVTIAMMCTLVAASSLAAGFVASTPFVVLALSVGMGGIVLAQIAEAVVRDSST